MIRMVLSYSSAIVGCNLYSVIAFGGHYDAFKLNINADKFCSVLFCIGLFRKKQFSETGIDGWTRVLIKAARNIAFYLLEFTFKFDKF